MPQTNLLNTITPKRVEHTISAAIITYVDSPATVKRGAESRGCSLNDAFIHVRFRLDKTDPDFENEEQEYTSSNTFRVLKKDGWQKLIDAKESQTPISLTIALGSKDEKGNTNTWLYLTPTENVSLDDFEEEAKKSVAKAKNAESLLAKLFGNK